MGRKKEPINVILEKGKKHLTKNEIEKRKSEELPIYDDRITVPITLPKKFHEEFLYYVEELQRLNIISNLDVEILEKYLIVKDLHNKSIQLLQEDDNFMNKDLVLIQEKYFKELITLSRELGLTITSRVKLVIPKKEDKNEENPLAKIFGDVL